MKKKRAKGEKFEKKQKLCLVFLSSSALSTLSTDGSISVGVKLCMP